MQNLAAFVLKGEDFEELKDYLEANAVEDCRYAFALWGALTGYVSISRKVLNVFSVDKNKLTAFFNASQKILWQDNLSLEKSSLKPDYTEERLNYFETEIVPSIPKSKKANIKILREGLQKTLQMLKDANNVEYDPLFIELLSTKQR